jgi:hypothetical protein
MVPSSSQSSLASATPTVQTRKTRPSPARVPSVTSLGTIVSPSSRGQRISPAINRNKPNPSRTVATQQASGSRSPTLTPAKDPLGNRKPSIQSPSPSSKPSLFTRPPISTAAPSDKRRQRIESSVSQAPRRSPKTKSRLANLTSPPPPLPRVTPTRAGTKSRVEFKTSAPKPSRSPSPTLPTIKEVPRTPLPRRAQPRTETWLADGDTRKQDQPVVFATDEENAVGDEDIPNISAPHIEELGEDADERPIAGPSTLQVSPRRPHTATAHWPVPSPLRKAGLSTPPDGTSNGNAQEFLRSLFADALSDALTDVRAETARGMQGLHLDLLHAGRTWRKELKDALGGVEDELRELREENARLREENERLRRGY